MEKRIQRLKTLIQTYLGHTKSQISKELGQCENKSDNEIWFYRKSYNILFREEIAFLFIEDEVVDVVITDYFLWIEIRNIFYFEGQHPEYKVINLI